MDMKSAGLLGCCILVAALIVSLVPRPQPAGGENGRYQFARSSGVSCFVLDTRTGRLWKRFVDQSGGPTEWSEDDAPWVEKPGGRR